MYYFFGYILLVGGGRGGGIIKCGSLVFNKGLEVYVETNFKSYIYILILIYSCVIENKKYLNWIPLTKYLKLGDFMTSQL